MKKIKNWLERTAEKIKENDKVLVRESVLKYLLLDFSTEESLKLKEEVDEQFKTIMLNRLEKVKQEKEAIELWYQKQK